MQLIHDLFAVDTATGEATIWMSVMGMVIA